MFLITWLKIVMVALTSKGQNFDCFHGKTPATKATLRIWSHRMVHFRSAHFGRTWTDCLCPLGPGRSLLLTFKGRSTLKFANSPGRASADSQMSQINFVYRSNSIQILVLSVIDSSHTRSAATRRWRFPCLPAGKGAQNCLPPLNLIRSTKYDLSTEWSLSCRCCYKLFLFLVAPCFYHF